jgi:hypothetical protein
METVIFLKKLLAQEFLATLWPRGRVKLSC